MLPQCSISGKFDSTDETVTHFPGVAQQANLADWAPENVSPFLFDFHAGKIRLWNGLWPLGLHCSAQKMPLLPRPPTQLMVPNLSISVLIQRLGVKPVFDLERKII